MCERYCHRSLIADVLTARGYEVRDIMSLASAKPHILKPMARVHGQQVTYPAEERETTTLAPEDLHLLAVTQHALGKRSDAEVSYTRAIKAYDRASRADKEKLKPSLHILPALCRADFGECLLQEHQEPKRAAEQFAKAKDDSAKSSSQRSNQILDEQFLREAAIRGGSTVAPKALKDAKVAQGLPNVPPTDDQALRQRHAAKSELLDKIYEPERNKATGLWQALGQLTTKSVKCIHTSSRLQMAAEGDPTPGSNATCELRTAIESYRDVIGTASRPVRVMPLCIQNITRVKRRQSFPCRARFEMQSRHGDPDQRIIASQSSTYDGKIPSVIFGRSKRSKYARRLFATSNPKLAL